MIQLFLRDVGLSVRSGGGFGLALIFFLIVVTLIPFALGPDQTALAVIAPGVLWLGALLACLLSLDRIFAPDPPVPPSNPGARRHRPEASS